MECSGISERVLMTSLVLTGKQITYLVEITESKEDKLKNKTKQTNLEKEKAKSAYKTIVAHQAGASPGFCISTPPWMGC